MKFTKVRCLRSFSKYSMDTIYLYCISDTYSLSSVLHQMRAFIERIAFCFSPGFCAVQHTFFSTQPQPSIHLLEVSSLKISTMFLGKIAVREHLCWSFLNSWNGTNRCVDRTPSQISLLWCQCEMRSMVMVSLLYLSGSHCFFPFQWRPGRARPRVGLGRGANDPDWRYPPVRVKGASPL